MMTLTQLIHAAPFDDATRGKILTELDSYTEDQKIELTETAWEMIAATHQNELDYLTDKTLLEAQEKKTPLSRDLLEAAQKQADLSIKSRFENAHDTEEIAKVQQEIAQQSS